MSEMKKHLAFDDEDDDDGPDCFRTVLPIFLSF